MKTRKNKSYLSHDVARLKSAVAGGGVRIEALFIDALALKYGLGLDESSVPELLTLSA
jgi:hypothetical protein